MKTKPNFEKTALQKTLSQQAKDITFPIARIIILMMENTAGPKLGIMPLVE
jgi:hypothetical protein